MATTSIGGDRGTGSALERYPDAAFMRDDKKFYFGNNGDVALEYDEDGNNVLLMTGNNLRLSDTVGIELGNSGDATISHNGTNTTITNSTGVILVSGAGGDIRLSDSVQLQLGSTSDVTLTFDGTSVIIGGLETAALSDSLPDTTGALFLRSDTSSVSDWLLAVRV